MELKYIANAGFWLGTGKTNILVDALHRGNSEGYPAVGDELWERMKSVLPQPELMFFTHCHPDHFSRSMMEMARGYWKDTMVAIPEKFGYEHHLLMGDKGSIELRDGKLEYFRLPHDGEEYGEVSHYGLLVYAEGLRVFIAGDCRIAAEELAVISELKQVDVAILAFPWLTLRAGRKFIDEVLRPKRIVVCHLPREEEDAYSYHEAAKRAIEKYYPNGNVCIMTEPLKGIVI